MVKLFPVEKTFSNYFLMDYPDTIEFNYSYGDGFETQEEAAAAITALGFEPVQFVFLQFCGLWYAVFIQEYQNQLAISRERLFLQQNDQKAPIHVYSIVGYTAQQIASLVPFRPTGSYGGKRHRSPAIRFDMEFINNGPIQCSGNLDEGDFDGDAFILYHNSIMFLGSCLFETNISVFRLDSVNYYSRDTLSSLERLWTAGIKEVNPFRNSIVYADKKPYTLNDWIKELQEAGVVIDGYDPYETANKMCTAWVKGAAPKAAPPKGKRTR